MAYVDERFANITARTATHIGIGTILAGQHISRIALLQRRHNTAT